MDHVKYRLSYPEIKWNNSIYSTYISDKHLGHVYKNFIWRSYTCELFHLSEQLPGLQPTQNVKLQSPTTDIF